MGNLKGHCAVITGASSGIGKEYAKQLAQRGCDLVIAARRGEILKDLAEKWSSIYGVRVWPISVDLSAPQGPQILFEAALLQGKEITILINNAGIGKYGTFTEVSLKDHLSTVFLNSVSPTAITHLFVKHMLDHGKLSYITQVASVVAFYSLGNFSVYCATKAYLLHFSEALALELDKSNVKVLCLCPGGTTTEFFQYSGQKIKKAGFKAMMRVEDVVRPALSAMLKGDMVYIPGILNKLSCFLPRFFSRKWMLSTAFRVYGKAVEKTRPENTSFFNEKNGS